MKRLPTISPCWHCGAPAYFHCARCHKPVCVTLGATTTATVSCAVLRKKRGEVGVFRLVCWPKCVHRRNPAVLALIAERAKPEVKTENPEVTDDQIVGVDVDPLSWKLGDPWPWERSS